MTRLIADVSEGLVGVGVTSRCAASGSHILTGSQQAQRDSVSFNACGVSTGMCDSCGASDVPARTSTEVHYSVLEAQWLCGRCFLRRREP